MIFERRLRRRSRGTPAGWPRPGGCNTPGRRGTDRGFRSRSRCQTCRRGACRRSATRRRRARRAVQRAESMPPEMPTTRPRRRTVPTVTSRSCAASASARATGSAKFRHPPREGSHGRGLSHGRPPKGTARMQGRGSGRDAEGNPEVRAYRCNRHPRKTGRRHRRDRRRRSASVRSPARHTAHRTASCRPNTAHHTHLPDIRACHSLPAATEKLPQRPQWSTLDPSSNACVATERLSHPARTTLQSAAGGQLAVWHLRGEGRSRWLRRQQHPAALPRRSMPRGDPRQRHPAGRARCRAGSPRAPTAPQRA